jgi:hypothetical protein
VTLDEYKEVYADRLATPLPEGDEYLIDLVLAPLFYLYQLALKGTEQESKECLAHWMSLPVEERLKTQVLELAKRPPEAYCSKIVHYALTSEFCLLLIQAISRNLRPMFGAHTQEQSGR